MGVYFWSIFCVVLLFCEMLIPGLITIWMAIAAFIVMIISYFVIGVLLEWFIFSFISLVLILYTRPFVKKMFFNKKHNFDSSMAGSEVLITKFINKIGDVYEYEVRFKGSVWTAISKHEYLVNDVVTIKSFQGNKILL